MADTFASLFIMFVLGLIGFGAVQVIISKEWRK